MAADCLRCYANTLMGRQSCSPDSEPIALALDADVLNHKLDAAQGIGYCAPCVEQMVGSGHEQTIRPARTIALAMREEPTPPVHSTEWLRTPQWRRLRLKVLAERGHRCEACGATPFHGAKLNVDHIKPRRYFPHLALEQDNLQVLCEACNHGKGSWNETDFRREFQ